MNATNQNPESDSLKIDYNEETGEILLEWDKEDPTWNWLNDLTQDQIKDIIITQFDRFIEETENGTSDAS